MKNTILFVAVFLSTSCFCSNEGYYWREYFGTVPEDALVAGASIDGKNIYIGQAYIKNIGLIVAPITPGVKEVSATYNGVWPVNKYIKILCGPKEKFDWMKANATDLHLQITNKHAILGGHEDKNGYLNIGRVSLSGETKVGKVNSFWFGNALFYFNDNGIERKLTSYEILIYKSTDNQLRFWEE